MATKKEARGLMASVLSTNRSIPNAIKDIVDSQIVAIDKQIKIDHEAGHDTTEYPLPTNFMLRGITNDDVQILVYYDLVSMYGDLENVGGKGFKQVRIVYREAMPFLAVSWHRGVNSAELAAKREKLKRLTIRA